ncbi:hypothetical protein Tco_1110544 [Tanacetum coccineum]|uniref:Uncharacterized protein n=1 Tax=Tanacetum coccineum TaxID=301880 RepID=A0ABQ5IJ33_9ASTR
MSNDNDGPSFGIPLVDVYESEPEAPEAVPQSPKQAPLSPAHDPEYPVYLAPSDDDLEPAEAQSLPVFVSPTALSPDYSTDSDPVEDDPEEDLEEDPSKEEELLAPAYSLPARLYTLTYHLSWVAALAPPLLPPSPLSPLSSPLPRIPSSPLLLPPPTCRDIIPKVDMPPQKRARFAASSHRFEIGESSAVAAAR